MSTDDRFPTPRQLALVAAVVEKGSASAAAAALGISQPSVTASLRAAEAALGQRLFVRKRGGGGFSPTAAGRAIAAYAVRHATARRNLLAALTEGTHGSGGLISIGASATWAEHWLPPRLRELRAQHPHADIRVVIGNASETASRVETGLVDVAVLGQPVRSRGVACAEVGADRIIAVAAAGSRYARAFPSPHGIAGATFIVREEGSSARARGLASLRRAGVVPSRLVPVASDDDVVRMAGAGAGIGLVSALHATKPIDAGLVASVRIHGWTCRRRFYLARRTDGLNPLVADLWAIGTSERTG